MKEKNRKEEKNRNKEEHPQTAKRKKLTGSVLLKSRGCSLNAANPRRYNFIPKPGSKSVPYKPWLESSYEQA